MGNPKQLTKRHVDDFIENVLNVGRRDNLFDVYLKQNGLPPHELTRFVGMVVDRLNEKWLQR